MSILQWEGLRKDAITQYAKWEILRVDEPWSEPVTKVKSFTPLSPNSLINIHSHCLLSLRAQHICRFCIWYTPKSQLFYCMIVEMIGVSGTCTFCLAACVSFFPDVTQLIPAKWWHSVPHEIALQPRKSHIIMPPYHHHLSFSAVPAHLWL